MRRALLMVALDRAGNVRQTRPSETPAPSSPRVETFDYIKREVMIPMRDGVKLQDRHPHSARRASRADPADAHALRRHGAHHRRTPARTSRR